MNRTLKILLIEDSEFYLSLIREFITSKQDGQGLFVMDSATTLQEGSRIAGQGTHDVILLDLTLPDCSGLETLVRMRAVSRKTPIIVITSADDEALSLQCLDLGAADYLIKGEVNANWLARSIRYAWHRSQKDGAADRASTSGSTSMDKTLEVTKSTETPGHWNVRIKVRRLVSLQELEQVRTRLSNLFKRGDCQHVNLDFSDVEYVSNATMSTLLILNKSAKSNNTELVFSNVPQAVRDQFVSRRFETVFQFA